MEKTFEQMFKELEEIVAALEKNELPLDEMIKKYNEGIKLGKKLTDTLANAKEVILKETR